jgi:hypothetical protein
MTLFGKKEEPIPVSKKPEDIQHKEVLPQGKPKGVAEVNGKSFEEAGVEPSTYKEDEYDVDKQFEEGAEIRNRELYGGVETKENESGLMDKLVR